MRQLGELYTQLEQLLQQLLDRSIFGSRVNKRQLHKLWAQLEQLLQQVLNRLSPQLSSEHTDIVQEYIDYNEFGLALDSLREYIMDDCVDVDDVTSAQMAELGELMDM